MTVRAPHRPAVRQCLRAVVAWQIVLPAALAVAAHPPEASGVAPSPLAAAARTLPFRPLQGPDDVFTASSLTIDYDHAWMSFSNPRGPRVDMAALDRHGYFPLGDVPADSAARALYERSLHPDVAEVTPADKEALSPPEAGAHVGIPSAAAATGALLGGLAILIKILTLGI